MIPDLECFTLFQAETEACISYYYINHNREVRQLKLSKFPVWKHYLFSGSMGNMIFNRRLGTASEEDDGQFLS